jgi:hypothetical protein
MRKLSHIIQVTLNFIASVLRRKRKGGLGYTGGHVETEAEMGVMQPLPRATRSCRRKEGLSPEPAEGMGLFMSYFGLLTCGIGTEYISTS